MRTFLKKFKIYTLLEAWVGPTELADHRVSKKTEVGVGIERFRFESLDRTRHYDKTGVSRKRCGLLWHGSLYWSPAAAVLDVALSAVIKPSKRAARRLDVQRLFHVLTMCSLALC